MNKHQESELSNQQVQFNGANNSETDNNKSLPSVLSMSTDSPRISNKFIFSGIALFLFVLLIGIYLLITYFSSPIRKWESFKGGIHLILEVDSKGDTSIDEANTLRIAETIENRIREFGLKNTIVNIQSPRQIVVQLPKFEQVDRLKVLLTTSGFLEFKLVNDEISLDDALRGNIPPDHEILYNLAGDINGSLQEKIPFLVNKRALMTGDFISDARVQIDQYNNPYLSILLNENGAKLFEKITAQNIGRRLAIVLDNSVYTAPIIQEKIPGGELQISGQFTLAECRDLAIALQAGSGGYPVKVSIIEERELTKSLWLGNLE